jgi:4-amino-4-deoxy-L-arabinose transferase-like glycosyltransferase
VSSAPAETDRAPFALVGTSVVTAALGLLLLVLAPRYGPHRDELYFAAAGHRLAWGYPDQPSLVELFARLTQDVGGHSLVLLRLPSLLAVCGCVVMMAALARVLGGDRRAQVLTAVLIATSAVVVFLGHRLTTQTLSMTAWLGLALVAAHALAEDRPRLWLVAGAVAGVGLNAKNDLVVALLGLFVGVAVTPAVRHHLRTVWWWGGGAVAVLLWLPDLVWQGQHGWPVFTLSAQIKDEYGGLGGALGYVGQTLVVFSPLMTLVWGAGLVGLLRRPEWQRVRPLGWVFVVTFLFFLVTGGKAYYLAGAIPPLLAAGAVLIARRRQRLVRLAVVLALSAAVAWPAGLPLLPARTYAASFYPALDDSGLESIGWPQLTDAVRRALAPLPKGAIVFTGNYGEAGALEWYGVRARVYSGHNAWGEWGPPPDSAAPVVVLGYEHGSPSVDFRGCHVVGHEPTVDGADNEENGLKIYVCAGPRTTWAKEWPRLRHLDA